jgi:flagellar hook-associated protein 3 FlgL
VEFGADVFMSYSLEAIFNSATWSISKQSSALSELQNQAATGQEINRVSDNPTDASRILGLKAESRSKEQYLSAINDALEVLGLSSSILQVGVSNEIADIRKTLTSVTTGTINTSMRRILANELNDALDQMVSLANTKRLGNSLFGGANTDIDAYAVVRDGDGEITSVTYQGSKEERKIDVAPGVQVSSVLTGESLFKADSERTYTFFGSTGAAMGSGTSSVRGDVMLDVTDAGGGNFTLSIDGGATTVTTTGGAGDANLAVVNASTGEVLYVDATGITSTGKDPIRVEGTYDIFNILLNTRDLLRNTESLSEAEIKAMLDATHESLQNVNRKFELAFPLMGGRIGTLTSLKASMEDTKVNTDEEISRLQDVDITQVAIKLAKHSVLYEMSLSVAAKMFSLSLFNFMG